MLPRNVKIEIFDEKLDVGTPKIEETIMYLYLGLGLDARVVYYFNHYRKKYPGFFKSRIGNKFVYTGIGSKGLISFSEVANFKNRLKIFYNGNTTKLPLPDPVPNFPLNPKNRKPYFSRTQITGAAVYTTAGTARKHWKFRSQTQKLGNQKQISHLTTPI
jgi:hypothetical protein